MFWKTVCIDCILGGSFDSRYLMYDKTEICSGYNKDNIVLENLSIVMEY